MERKKQGHVMVVPCPAQGHVKPLMLLSQKLAKHGFRVTFVNIEFIHNKILRSMADDDDKTSSGVGSSQIEMVSIPDGLDPMADRSDLKVICKLVWGDSILPTELEKLIKTINNNNDERMISCVVSDYFMSWPVEVAAKLGVKAAVFCPSAAAIFVYTINIPNFIRDGIITSHGYPTKQQIIQLSSGMPTMHTSKLPWNVGDLATQKMVFHGYLKVSESLKMIDWWLCNTSYDIEHAVFSLLPKLLPIGPLMEIESASPLDTNPGSQFWVEDSSCLSWLDQHKPRSVIYIAFGSFTTHDQIQFHELARGLELTSKPFLWVVRPGSVSGEQKLGLNSHGFGGNDNLRKIINWAPQQKVLSHPSIACFVSHCGWNSTIEGLSNGVPFLTWPYFADQYMDESYICDVWKVGMKLVPNENGIVTSEEVKNKVDKLLYDKDIQRRSLEFKEIMMKSISKDGQSSKNLNSFVKWIKEA
ncbi:hypothetical protein CsatB_021096 [Cannabis sativa]